MMVLWLLMGWLILWRLRICVKLVIVCLVVVWVMFRVWCLIFILSWMGVILGFNFFNFIGCFILSVGWWNFVFVVLCLILLRCCLVWMFVLLVIVFFWSSCVWILWCYGIRMMCLLMCVLIIVKLIFGFCCKLCWLIMGVCGLFLGFICMMFFCMYCLGVMWLFMDLSVLVDLIWCVLWCVCWCWEIVLCMWGVCCMLWG